MMLLSAFKVLFISRDPSVKLVSLFCVDKDVKTPKKLQILYAINFTEVRYVGSFSIRFICFIVMTWSIARQYPSGKFPRD